ncbi:hypothetical protein KFE25_005926 [Diacronema lutheri]|uniref:Myb-like domain-containing protein n=2 Tax=Diacronema lutheri TaxID=2081491 RepID=A0A8J5XUZ4_DIALT|nr:hypothetical protein KFE25_005926 [Diacronema lutheri]
MGQTQSGVVGLEVDEDLLTRATELLSDAHVRKRTRDDELAAPPPMFSLPKPSLPTRLSDLAGADEYTNAVLAAAGAYLSSGGKACKPIGAVSAGSIGRKGLVLPEVSEASAGSHACPASPDSATPPPAVPGAAAASLVTQRPPAQRVVVYKCRRCGSTKPTHQCSEHHAAQPAAVDQRLVPWTSAEDDVICAGVEELGFKWSHIAARLDGRTDNAVRNRWHRLDAARKWRAEVQLASTDGAEALPGYKCGRCGQPKRGHQCPFGVEAPPAAAASVVRVTTRVDSSESTHAQPTADAPPLPGATELELAELFASLEASPACDDDDGYDEDDLVELVHGIISPHELEHIMSGRDELHTDAADADGVQWLALQAGDGSTCQQPAHQHDGEQLSADGGVCF